MLGELYAPHRALSSDGSAEIHEDQQMGAWTTTAVSKGDLHWEELCRSTAVPCTSQVTDASPASLAIFTRSISTVTPIIMSLLEPGIIAPIKQITI